MSLSPAEAKAVFLDEITPYTDAYSPSETVAGYAAGLDITALIGPAGVGKNTIMAATGLPFVKAITSRPARPGDSYLRHYDLTDATERQEVLCNLQKGLFVQAVSHPATKELYGSLPESYDPSQSNLFDVLADNYYDLLHSRIFEKLSGVYVVAPSYGSWQQRWRNRGEPLGDREYRNRMAEAHASLTRCLDDPDMPFLVNDYVEVAALQLRRHIVYGEEWSAGHQLQARNVAHSLLKSITDSGVLVA